MSLRRLAVLLAALGLVAGLVGTGVGAQFVDQVTAVQNISVGTFSCQITASSAGTIAPDGKSVTYNAPAITSSAAASSPFSFTVKNTGSISQTLNVTTTGPNSPFSIIGAPFAPVTLTGGNTTTYATGLQWTELSNGDLGATVTATWTVNCDESSATHQVIFNNTASALAGNYPSYGPEAYAYKEWGGGATFAGTNRKLAAATITLSSWACQSGGWNTNDCVTTPGATFNVPITFNVYNVGAGNTVGSLVATHTQTFAIPYRPSADNVHCTGGNAGKWYDGTTCFNGKAVDVTIALGSEVVGNTAIFGVSFNTSHYGYAPLGGTNHPTDSLNIATYPGTGVATQASVGTWLPNDISGYIATGATLVGNSPVTYMPTGPGDNFVGYMPAVLITASN